MNRPYHRISKSLMGLLLVIASLSFLPACNSGGNGGTTTESPSPSPTEGSPSASVPSPTTEEGNPDPISAGLTGGDRPDTDPLELLQSDQLKQELKLTEDQSKKIEVIETDFRAKLSQKMSGINWKELTPEQQTAKFNELDGQIQTQIQDTRKQIGEALTPEQLTRFKQIGLQIYGFGVLNYEDFITELNLTKEQQDQFVTMRQEMAQKMRANWEIPKSDNAEENKKIIDTNRKRLEQIIMETNEKALTILTPEQQKTLETLKGEKFEFTPPSPAT